VDLTEKVKEMPTIEVNRTHITTPNENPDGEVDIEAVQGKLVAFTLTKEGTQVTLYLSPIEADAIGVGLIKQSLVAASGTVSKPKPGSPILRSVRG
jgi:hypothetical protein